MDLKEHAPDGRGAHPPSQGALQSPTRLSEPPSIFFASRRAILRALLLTPLVATAPAQDPTQDDRHLPKMNGEEDTRLPNGKSQRDEIARQQHADALKDVDALVAAAQELRDELKHAGQFVIPVTSLRKTEEIEKLAKKIRGRLKS